MVTSIRRRAARISACAAATSVRTLAISEDRSPDRHADLRAPTRLERKVSDSEILKGPEESDVEVGSAGEVRQKRRGEVAAAAERSAAHSEREGRQEGAVNLLPMLDLGGDDLGVRRVHLGTALNGRRDQAWKRQFGIDSIRRSPRRAATASSLTA